MTRKSDSKQYVGITIDRNQRQRLWSHRNSNRFKDDDFSFEILEESSDRNYIESQETYWIQKFDTYHNGLNETKTGKGFGHSSSKFTTLGYKFSEKSKDKMRKSAKARVDPENMRQISLNMWKDPKMRKHHSDVRKNRRLRPPKFSDKEIEQIRNRYHDEFDSLKVLTQQINETRHAKNSSWKKSTVESTFANLYAEEYGCSSVFLKNVVSNKTRIESYPPAYQEKNK